VNVCQQKKRRRSPERQTLCFQDQQETGTNKSNWNTHYDKREREGGKQNNGEKKKIQCVFFFGGVFRLFDHISIEYIYVLHSIRSLDTTKTEINWTIEWVEMIPTCVGTLFIPPYLSYQPDFLLRTQK
jgi:hypothetical protein